jgi:hypothetical protein
MKKILILLLIACISVGVADAKGKKKKKKKKAVIEQPAPPPVVETPIDTTPPPPPPPADTIPAEPTVKPYEKLELYVDSSTNLISYMGVVEQPENSSDSLYIRAKKWAEKTFKGGKSLYEVDKKNQKIVINGFLPAFAYGNKYGKRPIGKYQFKMTIWFKEERYKYAVSNLVHEGTKANIGSTPRNYFEYYYTSLTNLKGNDQLLRYANKDINAMIDDFKKAMKDPLLVDEDEW